MDEMFHVVAEDVRKSQVIDLPMRLRTTGQQAVSAVLAADRDYFTAAVEAMLLGGQFKVLGKVTGVDVSPEESLTIVRRGVIGLIGQERLEQLISATRNDDLNLRIPEVTISSPWIQVLPLAIFV